MRRYLIVFFSFALLIFGCSKDDRNNTGSNNSGNTNTGGNQHQEEFVFSVGTGKRVKFAPGNLAKDGRSFVSNQYDLGGYFAWGTGNHPESSSTDWRTYSTFYDWGDYLEGNWRTLTGDEWQHLLLQRQNATYKRGRSVIGGIKGLIILPDNWKQPSGVEFEPTLERVSQNEYSINEWNILRNSGAIFLPCTIIGRSGHYDCGFYWSSSPYDERMALHLQIEFEGNDAGEVYVTKSRRYYQESVRLVQDVK